MGGESSSLQAVEILIAGLIKVLVSDWLIEMLVHLHAVPWVYIVIVC